MKLVEPGTLQGFANETTMSNHLLQYAISEPEIMNQVTTMFRDVATFQSILADRNLTAKGLFAGLQNERYRVVGNRKVMWPVKAIADRKGTILGFEAADTTYPGRYGDVVRIFVDTNWFSPYDTLELEDNRTIVTVVNDQLPEEVESGKWAYDVRINRSSDSEFIDPNLLAAGNEIGFAYTNFYEGSETAYEKYTFDGWASSWMTIQRMKWSISGTAAQMKTGKYWVSHNGEMAWVTMQELKMMERWAKAREFQLLKGKGTVGDGDTVYLKDLKGRDIVSGDGLLNIGDGTLKFPVNNMGKKDIINVMNNLAIYSNTDGVMEVAVVGGRSFMNRFSEIMRNEFKVSPQVMVEGNGTSKGVNATFSWFELDGVRLVPRWSKWFDDISRPSSYSADGTRRLSNDAIFVSLGNTEVGMPNVELIALGNRSFKQGTVYGIDVGGDNMKTSVDAQHTHVLSESGIVVRDPFGVAEIYQV